MITFNERSTYTDILGNLEALPMFRLSLGSKELFHSNFLEFLWITDKSRFIQMMEELLPDFNGKIDKNDIKKYTLGREKENFDICIYHKNNKDKDIYDLIIENKVKSIPRQEQLEGYYLKCSKNNSTPFLVLLSLVEEFPDKSIIQDEKNQEKMGKWEIVNYQMLYNSIEKCYKDLNNTYIKDYCDFIKYLHPLQKRILEDFNKENGCYFDFDELEAYKKLRLHDLYIKLRGALFLQKLKRKLEEKPLDNVDIFMMPCERAKTYTEIRSKKSNINENTQTEVFLNYTIQQGAGMVAAFIYRKNTDGDKIIEVVIQGNQYRHGINSQKYKNYNLSESDKLDKLWNDVMNCEFMKKTKSGKDLGVKKGNFNKYNDDYIYRYYSIDKETVKDLIGWMTDDIKYVIDESNNHGLFK